MQKWEYTWTDCWYEVTTRGALGGDKEGEWLVAIGKGHWTPLIKGLDSYGEKGWELVGMQITGLPHGGEISKRSKPRYRYIFKRPKP
jgi:hypothetical protein